MVTKKPKSNELRLQQLRSFCETARLGSLTAAAQSLGLTQPTIGEQVHALEREFAEKLVEPHGRGCRLTEAGATLAGLAGPLIAGIDSLKASFEEARKKHQARITVACSPRVLAEDILDCLPGFERQYPDARVVCREMHVEDVMEAVQSGNADVGLTIGAVIDRTSPWVEVEEGYDLDVLLVTPKDHPLATKREISVADIAEYPVINMPDSLRDPAVVEGLKKGGIFKQQKSKVEATYTAAVRGFVEQGFGIGFVFGIPGRGKSTTLHERSLYPLVGRIRIDLVWRRGAIQQRLARAFADCVKSSMKAKLLDSEAKPTPTSTGRKK
jgi:DNA-binding transcriptional LysR family regulator